MGRGRCLQSSSGLHSLGRRQDRLLVNLRVAFLLLLFFVAASGVRAAEGDASPWRNEFFAMDTAVGANPASVIPLLKELGYDGLGAVPRDAAALASAAKDAGLRLYTVYLTVQWEASKPALTAEIQQTIDALQGHGSALWIAIASVQRDGKAIPRSSEDGDKVACEKLRELADYASPRGVKIALYHHTGSWLESFNDCLRVADKVNRPAVGVTFNLCHWLKSDAPREPQYVLKMAIPRLMFVTINGADSGETQKMDWKRLIQPLGAGSYDMLFFLRILRSSGYRGPIGLQGYGIKMETRELLRKSIEAWKDLQAKVNKDEQSTREELASILRTPDLSPSLTPDEVSSTLPPEGATAEEIASGLSAEGAAHLSEARRMLGSKLPRVAKLTLYSLLPYSEKIDAEHSGLARFHDYPILGEITISDPDEANRWVNFLRDQVLPGGHFACGFAPRHGFRLTTANGKVDILMCYSCEQLAAFGLPSLDRSINPVFSSRTKDIVNRLFDKMKIPRDDPGKKPGK